jgi:hypothetical protein
MTPKPDTAADLDAAQVAELAQLQAEAAADPTAALPPGAEPEPAPPSVDLAAELSGLIQTVTAVLSPALPSLAGIYTADACQKAGAAIAAVCNKRGWLQNGVLGGYGEELAALAIVGPMAIATYQGVQADLDAMKKHRAAAAAAPADAPRGEFAVTVGAPAADAD